MTRAGALATRRSRSRRVSRCGPSTLVANVSSSPSAVSRRSARQHARVVHEHVHGLAAGQQALGAGRAPSGAARCRRARSARPRCPSRRRSRRRASSPAPGVAHEQAQRRAEPREPVLAASPSPPLAPVTRQTRPPATAAPPSAPTRPRTQRADAREAPDHAGLERRIDQPGEPAAGRHAEHHTPLSGASRLGSRAAPHSRSTRRRPPKDLEQTTEGAASRAPSVDSGGRIRTCDLRVMSPTSYRTAPPRVVVPDGSAAPPAMQDVARCRDARRRRRHRHELDAPAGRGRRLRTAPSRRSSACSRSRASARASTPAARSPRCRWARVTTRSSATRSARARSAPSACSPSRRAPCATPPTATTSSRASRRRGFEPRLLSGEEEAATTFAGVCSRAPGGERVSADGTLVVDVGGGSTELVLGAADGVAWSRSLQAGCVRMTERFLGEDVVAGTRLDGLRRGRRRAARGRARTRSSRRRGARSPSPAPRRRWPRSRTAATRRTPCTAPASRARRCASCRRGSPRMPLAERRDVPGLEPARAPVIVAGLVVLGLRARPLRARRGDRLGARHPARRRAAGRRLARARELGAGRSARGGIRTRMPLGSRV